MLATVLLCVLASVGDAPAGETEPKSLDPRVVIEQFAAEPDIVTPTGIAIDQRGRVLVVESHTHFRPADYAGPPADRIRALVDTDGDGRADQVTNFYEGGTATMNLAVYDDGSVFVATRMEISRLFDHDNDGKADERLLIAHLETAGNYPHNGLSGFAFDGLGNVYFGLGENLGAKYRLVGTDGAALEGGGEGGSIYRCRPDGTKLTRIATGFWNPFHLCCDAYDRLFAVDNDPDSRPPCRLLHIVPEGDYGYRYRNGRKGVHPFTAWNGELPGTLPMTAGTGEAPSGVLAYESDALPTEYVGTLLVTSWGDHRIDSFRLNPHGASFRALAEPIVTGGDNFRPVVIALAADGSLYVSDWVDKSYDLHGKGRVWHIRARDAVPLKRPSDPAQALLSGDRPLRQKAGRMLAGSPSTSKNLTLLSDVAQKGADPRVRADALIALARAGKADSIREQIALHDSSADVQSLAIGLGTEYTDALRNRASPESPSLVRAAALRRLSDTSSRTVVIAALADSDPFIAQAARTALAHSATIDERLSLAAAESSAQRLAAIFLLRELPEPAARAVLPTLLRDADPTVRFAAVQWVAEAGLQEFRNQVVDGLATGATTRALFEAYLAALERLDGVQRAVKDEWSGDQYVLALLENPETASAVRVRALRALRPDHPGLTPQLLGTLLASTDPAMRLETVRTLRERKDPLAVDQVEQIAVDERAAIGLRAEAIVGVANDTSERRALLLNLATGNVATLGQEALRSLRGAPLDAGARDRLVTAAAHETDAELVTRLLGTSPNPPHPDRADREAWLALVQAPGDAATGERIFFHPRGPACYRCHQVDGRGGTIGPELSFTPQTLSAARLLESLLEPSKEIAPQFTVWNVVRNDGTMLTGVLLSDDPDGTRRYGTADGEIIGVQQSEVAEVRPQNKSLMPDSLCDQLTPSELRDLFAYLRSPR
ncbi:MAG TPA: PVC-type heme-binding CxxCH protein [Pirellulales bacterium]|jgi:putative membrane-bound dehydrogenase-like protein